MQLGEVNKLYIIRSREQGLYLGHQDQTEGGVLLPNAYVTPEMQIGDEIEAFIYHDGEQRLTATTTIPKISLHGFAALEVKAVAKFGLFLDWGLPKDLLLPFSELKSERPQVGDKVVVFLYIDEETSRLVASGKVEEIIDNTDLTLNEGDQVEILPYRKTELGYLAIINAQYIGLLYKTDIFKPVKVGERYPAYVKKIREDKKVDLILQKQGFNHVLDSKGMIYKKLQEAGGFLPYTDKSKPDDIYAAFNMSKKVFKKAIGGLYNERKITLEKTGIKIVD